MVTSLMMTNEKAGYNLLEIRTFDSFSNINFNCYQKFGRHLTMIKYAPYYANK